MFFRLLVARALPLHRAETAQDAFPRHAIQMPVDRGKPDPACPQIVGKLLGGKVRALFWRHRAANLSFLPCMIPFCHVLALNLKMVFIFI